MFDRLFKKRVDDGVRMPEVDVPADLDAIFEQARRAARGEGDRPPGRPGRNVIIVTPGRMLKFQACPDPDSMPEARVAPIERMMPRAPRRNVAAIAYTELAAIQANAGRAIPFLGFLLGFAYLGHAVWVFEGHPSALAHGCRDADVLFVDGAMAPHLQSDWPAVAAAAMRRPEIYLHDRATYSLKKIVV
jgi:hypothetical protein